MKIRDIRHDSVIMRIKRSFERYCAICGRKFVTSSPKTATCSDECTSILSKDINEEVYGIFLEKVPQALSVVGFDSVDEYIEKRDDNNDKNTGFVYFVQSGDSVKIGYAKDVNKRIKSLQTGNQEKLLLIGYIVGDLKKESEIHGMFDDYRLTGEWFKYSDEIREYIDSLELLSGKNKIAI